VPPRFDSASIAATTGGEVVRAGRAGPITANSQTCAAGEWFVALAGEGFDDHAFVPEAVARGVSGVVVEQDVDVACGVVRVHDTWQALRGLGRAARHRFQGPVVGITGSTGKTTTRLLTAHALSVRGKVQQNEGNSNADPGVALTMLGVPDDAWATVVELGTCVPGRIARYSAICEPDVRVVTHVGPAHLDGLRDLEGVAREKGGLLAAARPGDVAVVNLADPKVAQLPIPEGVRRIGVGSGGDVSLASFELDPESLCGRAAWQTPTGLVTATLRSPAAFVAEDAALALAVAYALNVDLREAAAALEVWAPEPGRLCPLRLDCGATVLDDTFNANPQSVAAALDLLAGLPGRRVAVLGDMAELGERSHAHHQQIASHAVGLGLERVLLIGRRFATAVGRNGYSVEGAAAALEGWLRPGDVVLVKGSRTMGLEAVVQALRAPPALA